MHIINCKLFNNPLKYLKKIHNIRNHLRELIYITRLLHIDEFHETKKSRENWSSLSSQRTPVFFYKIHV